MKIEISFLVQRTEVPNHHTDHRFSKVFDVEWPGRPMAGESIDLDISPPGDDPDDFQVAEIYWGTERPPLVALRRMVIPEDEQEPLDRYIEACRKKGWEVS
jgi:hypothetical protein